VFGPGVPKRRTSEWTVAPGRLCPESYLVAKRPDTLDIVHPLLRQYVAGAPVATKLSARLSPADMREDVWLHWTVSRRRGPWCTVAPPPGK